MNEHWRYDECSVAFYHEGIETDMYKVVDALNAAEFRIAELEGLVDKLIEVGEWGVTGMGIATSFRGGEMHNLAIKQGDKWDALVKDWKER